MCYLYDYFDLEKCPGIGWRGKSYSNKVCFPKDTNGRYEQLKRLKLKLESWKLIRQYGKVHMAHGYIHIG